MSRSAAIALSLDAVIVAVTGDEPRVLVRDLAAPRAGWASSDKAPPRARGSQFRPARRAVGPRAHARALRAPVGGATGARGGDGARRAEHRRADGARSSTHPRDRA